MRHTYCTEDAFRERAAQHGATEFVWTEDRDGPIHRFRLAALVPGEEFPIAEYTGTGTPDSWLWTEEPRDRTLDFPADDEDIMTREEKRGLIIDGAVDGLGILALLGVVALLLVGLAT